MIRDRAIEILKDQQAVNQDKAGINEAYDLAIKSLMAVDSLCEDIPKLFIVDPDVPSDVQSEYLDHWEQGFNAALKKVLKMLGEIYG